MLVYVERWLKVPVQLEDGDVVTRRAGTPQGGAISPLLANLFLRYPFDAWMARTFLHIPFERYADDIVCHCRSPEAAQALRSALQDRLAACKLELHPQKTKTVYRKDANRRGDFEHTSFEFLGFTFRVRKAMNAKGKPFACFLPAISRKAMTAISRKIRRWRLHLRSDKPLEDPATMANPHIRGRINYFGNFYRTELRPTLTSRGSISMSLAGHAANPSGCVAKPKAPGTV